MGRARPSGMRFLIALLFAFLGTAHAATTYTAQPTWTFGGGGISVTTGTDAAVLAQANLNSWAESYAGSVAWCSQGGGSGANWYFASTGTQVPSGGSGETVQYLCNGGGQQRSMTRATACGANSTLAGGTCTCTGSNVVNPAGNACEAPNACTPEVGTQPVTNFTLGWAVDPNKDPVDSTGNVVGPWLAPKLGDYVCVPTTSPTTGCRRFIDAAANGDQVWVSKEPAASGLYRMSIDYVTIPQGTTCTPSAADTAASPTAPNPACPGFVGSVNGVTMCVPKAGGPALPSPTNPASAPRAGAPVAPGNPAAGDKPATGSGSGAGEARTPVSGGGGAGTNSTSGGGGNSGGSSSATGGGTTGGPKGSGTGGSGTTGGGTSGSGTTTTDKPTPPCGLPNTAKCRIDETGTGTGEGALTSAKANFDTEAGKQNTQIGGAGTSVTGVAWNWAFTLPSGACTPFDFSTRLGPVSINPCTNTWFALFRSAMGYFFFGLTGFYIWHKATSAPTGGK